MRNKSLLLRLPALVMAALAVATESAFAHHAMGGNTPSTFGQGFISGLAHPVIGVDHLAFIVGVGLLAAACGKAYRLTLPLLFVAMTAVGALTFVAGTTLPFAEVVIALSVAIVGVLLISGKTFAVPYFAGLFAVAGIFHGYAYGGSIVGAETSPLLAYLAGFALIQYVIAVGASFVLELGRKAADQVTIRYERVAGGIIAGVALVFVVENIETLLLGAV